MIEAKVRAATDEEYEEIVKLQDDFSGILKKASDQRIAWSGFLTTLIVSYKTSGLSKECLIEAISLCWDQIDVV